MLKRSTPRGCSHKKLSINTPKDIHKKPTKSHCKGLKLSALGPSEMGRKDFPGSDLMISQEPQMYPPQLSHPHWLSDVPKMISPSESDEKPGNRCALPSSQLGRKGIIGFSLAGTSRITKSPQKLRPHPE
jgi:hypothetical protein